MLQRFLFIALTLCSLTASAQWQQTGSKVRYVNGLGIPTKDTAAGVAADSSQIVIRPADSALYIKYKRTWLRVGGGGGSIAGSGTTNYIPKFTSATAIGNSQIFDNGTNVGIGTASPWESLSIPFNSKLSFGSSTYPLSISRSSAGNLITTISDNYDVINTRIDFVMRNGSVNQNTPLSLISSGNVGIGYTAPAAKLSVDGTTLINTNTDNGVDKLQVSGSAIVTTGLQAATTSGNVSLRNTATTYPINITTGTTSGIGMYQDAGTAVIIGTNAAVTAMSPISIRGTLVDLDGNLKVNAAGRVLIGNPTPNDLTGEALQVSGAIICDQFKLWGLNTAPATASSSGTLGEIRIDANYIYICTATNTWKRVAIATW
jgi:hypothetical protein